MWSSYIFKFIVHDINTEILRCIPFLVWNLKFQHQCLRSWNRIPVMIRGFGKSFRPAMTFSRAVIGQSSSILQCHWMSPLMFDLKLLITMSKKKNYFSSSSDIHISWKTFKYLKVFWWLGYDPKWTAVSWWN